eukprot:sb/3466635/
MACNWTYNDNRKALINWFSINIQLSTRIYRQTQTGNEWGISHIHELISERGGGSSPKKAKPSAKIRNVWSCHNQHNCQVSTSYYILSKLCNRDHLATARAIIRFRGTCEISPVGCSWVPRGNSILFYSCPDFKAQARTPQALFGNVYLFRSVYQRLSCCCQGAAVKFSRDQFLEQHLPDKMIDSSLGPCDLKCTCPFCLAYKWRLERKRNFAVGKGVISLPSNPPPAPEYVNFLTYHTEIIRKSRAYNVVNDMGLTPPLSPRSARVCVRFPIHLLLQRACECVSAPEGDIKITSSLGVSKTQGLFLSGIQNFGCDVMGASDKNSSVMCWSI